MEHLQYPIGPFKGKATYTDEELDGFLAVLTELPAKLEVLVSDITDKQLSTPYREGGWTARQVLHHIADSHMNALVRIKWTLTESEPTIKPYLENRWALQSDYALPIEVSVSLLKGIHMKMVTLLKGLDDSHLNRQFFHPETQKFTNLKKLMASYAWHSEHHLAHIKICKGEWKGSTIS